MAAKTVTVKTVTVVGVNKLPAEVDAHRVGSARTLLSLKAVATATARSFANSEEVWRESCRAFIRQEGEPNDDDR